MAVRELGGRAGAERVRARQALVDHHARGPHVGRRRGGVAAAGLGGHVGEGAEEPVVDGRVGVGDGGDAEVGEPHGAVAPEQDVRRLDVAVDDAVRVGVREGVADGGRDAEERLVRQRLLAQGALQVAAVHELRDDVDVLVVLEDLAQAHDVGMAEPRGDRDLAPRALPEDGVVRDGLDGHGVAGLLVVRAEDRARAADAEHSVDPEPAEHQAGREQRRSGLGRGGVTCPATSRGTGCVRGCVLASGDFAAAYHDPERAPARPVPVGADQGFGASMTLSFFEEFDLDDEQPTEPQRRSSRDRVRDRFGAAAAAGAAAVREATAATAATGAATTRPAAGPAARRARGAAAAARRSSTSGSCRWSRSCSSSSSARSCGSAPASATSSAGPTATTSRT